MELHSYFLEVKEIFDGRGNVRSHHPGGGRLDQRIRAADQTSVWDLGGRRDIRSEEVDPSLIDPGGRGMALRWCTHLWDHLSVWGRFGNKFWVY